MKDTLYLLTGAAGLLGSSISRALIAQNKRVRALVLPGDPAKERVPGAAEIVIGDIMDDASLEAFFSVPEDTEIVVIHCASLIVAMPGNEQRLYDVNVRGTQNIVDKCLEFGARKLVYISSTSAIPELPGGQPIREVDAFDPQSVIGVYGQSKAEATRLVLEAVRQRGLDASIVFPSGIFGPNDYGFGYITSFVSDFGKGKVPFGIAGSFNAVDVRDLAAGVIACAEKGRKGEGYIMANKVVSFRDMVGILHRETGARAVRAILPLPVARIVAFFASIQSMVTGKPALVTGFNIYNLARNNDFSSAKAAQELGFTARPFEETIADTVTWLAQEGKIQVQRRQAAQAFQTNR